MAKTYTSAKTFFMWALAMLLFISPSFAFIAPSSLLNPLPAKKAEVSSPLSTLNVQDFLTLTPKKYKELTGQKLSFTQKLTLKMAQKKIGKAVKNNEAINGADMQSAFDTSDFNIGGFVLGLLLSVVGVLIAYLIGDEEVIKWAWIGFGIVALIFILTLIF